MVGIARSQVRPNTGNHVSAAIIGDSLTGRHYSSTIIYKTDTAIGFWNWANWLIGAPYVFRNYGVSGDLTQSIMSRISAISDSERVVFLMTGTNDVFSMSAAANQATIDSTYTTVSGYIQSGINALLGSGKKIVIATIIPNNAYSSSSDSRIQLLDRLNAFITGLAGQSVFVVDAFTALWDSAQPTLRVCKANTMHTDGTHIAASGSLLIGQVAMTAAKSAYHAVDKNIDIYAGFTLCKQLYTTFRGTGGTKTAGTGSLADGWRTLNNGGTATFTLDNTSAYSYSADYVLPNVAGVDERWQQINITSAANGDEPRLQMATSLANGDSFPDGVNGGDLFFAEIDVLVENPVALTCVSLRVFNLFTAGTSPADQPYAGTSQHSVGAGSVSDFSSAIHAVQSGYRLMLRTPVLRSPENINTTIAQSAQFYVDMDFNGAGSALVKLGRPRLWRKA